MKSRITNLSRLTIAAIILLCLSTRVAPTFATSAPPGTYPSTLVPGPDPPLNPTALLQIGGDYNMTAAGTALRNTGSGVITVSYTGTVVAAYLVWGIMDYSQESSLASASINGHAITGTLQSQDSSPCWSPTYLYVFAADVTNYVTNGANTVSGFASGATDGSDPWSTFASPMADGASLFVVTTGATANNIYLYTGTYTEPFAGNPLTSTFNHGAADATTATTTFFVLDGQLPGNYAQYNGVTIDSNAFPGSDPKTSSATWSYGTLSDTKTYSVPEILGATSDSASIGATEGDCLTWAAQSIIIPSTASVPPIGVPPPPSTVPQFGVSSILMAAIGVALVAFLKKGNVRLGVSKN